MRKLSLALAAAALACGNAANAAQIMMGASNIVGATESLGSAWGAANIFNQQTGTIAPEAAMDGSFWLHRDSNPLAYITIDLGDVYSNLSFDLFNTHNGHHFDRGVGDFEILAGSELIGDGANGLTLGGGIVRLVNGKMLAEHDATIDAQTFAARSGGYRYIQFRPRSVAATRPYPFGEYAYGLNEMRIYGDLGVASGVPEASTWALMITGFGAAGAMLRARRRGGASLSAQRLQLAI